MNESRRIMIWCGEAANQKALANKIAANFPVAGIVIDRKVSNKKAPFLSRLITAIQDRLLFRTILDAWSTLNTRYSKDFPEWPAVPLIKADTINSDEAYEFTRQINPDLVIVSGTGLVRKKMLSIKPSIGIINLHTGLSPYIKGGPNCTNWCIATNQLDRVGNTIMWINEGIDSGNIITSETITLGKNESLAGIHWRVMEHAHDLYLKAIKYLVNTQPPYNSVPQDEIAKGQLYLTRMWNFARKRDLLQNLKNLSSMPSNSATPVTTVPLK